MDIGAIIGVLIIVFWFVLDKLYHHHLEKKLIEHVRWCTAYNDYRESLYFYIYDKYSKLNIEKKYRLKQSDKQLIGDIIKAYQEDLTKSYMQDNLITNKRIASFTNEEYFFFSLRAFLCNHECELEFLGKSMYNILNQKYYGNSLSFSATYGLNEYSETFHRLYLVSELVCENSERINKCGYYYNSTNIKETLDTKKMHVLRD